jgi:hypothetical protein
MLYTIPDFGVTVDLSAVRVIHQRGSNADATWFSIIMADVRDPLVVERYRPKDMPAQLWTRAIELADASYQSLLAAKAAHGVDVEYERARFAKWYSTAPCVEDMHRSHAEYVWEAALQLAPKR